MKKELTHEERLAAAVALLRCGHPGCDRPQASLELERCREHLLAILRGRSWLLVAIELAFTAQLGWCTWALPDGWAVWLGLLAFGLLVFEGLRASNRARLRELSAPPRPR